MLSLPEPPENACVHFDVPVKDETTAQAPLLLTWHSREENKEKHAKLLRQGHAATTHFGWYVGESLLQVRWVVGSKRVAAPVVTVVGCLAQVSRNFDLQREKVREEIGHKKNSKSEKLRM